jgi:hypothetical protein
MRVFPAPTRDLRAHQTLNEIVQRVMQISAVPAPEGTTSEDKIRTESLKMKKRGQRPAAVSRSHLRYNELNKQII